MGCGASNATVPEDSGPKNVPALAATNSLPGGRQGRSADKATNAVRRLVLYASNTPDKQDFAAMVKCKKREYDFATATKDDLIRLVQDAAGGRMFNSIALATHGDNAKPGFEWLISEKLVVTGGDLTPDVTALMRALGDATTTNGRIDLLACSLLNEEKGRMAFEAIEKTSDAHFAASSDITGNVKSGGDWVMESDGTNIKSLYFSDSACNFDGTFGNMSGWTAVSDQKSEAGVWVVADSAGKETAEGKDGLSGLLSALDEKLVQFAAIRVVAEDIQENVTSQRPKIMRVNWVGMKVPAMKKMQALQGKATISEKWNGSAAEVDANTVEEIDMNGLSCVLLHYGGAHKPTQYNFGPEQIIPLSEVKGYTERESNEKSSRAILNRLRA